MHFGEEGKIVVSGLRPGESTRDSVAKLYTLDALDPSDECLR